MGPSVSAFEAAISDSSRAERDRQLAGWCGRDEGPFLRYLSEFDEARALESLLVYARAREAVIFRLAEIEDTRAGLLARVDALIADLDSWGPS